MQRPIQPPNQDAIEPNYRYGSTQNGKREVHHGVEFINKAGVPVVAAADGTVVIAGNDQEQVFADKYNFYGNLVVIKHTLADYLQPVYTLYAHLLKVGVTTGKKVGGGQQIGEVGVGGVAAGTHLHFEVRFGVNSYEATRNPEMWLSPHTGTDGQFNGTLAGRILSRDGNALDIQNIVIKQISQDGQIADTFYLQTYAGSSMLGLQPWYESFAMGDLPPGIYRVSFIYRHEQAYLVQVWPGKLTYLVMIGE